jgi:acyl-CoA synthetase (NDP forming)
LAELRRQYPHKDLVLVMLSVPASTEKLEAIGIPVFADPTRAMKAMGAAANMAAQRNRLYVMPTEKPVGTMLTDVSTEQGAKLALKMAGLPVLIEKVCSSAELASEFATEIGFPVVAKIASPDILHKTEMGGVLLNLQDAADVKAGFEKLMTRAQQHAPNAQIDGVLITPMVKGGVETILGVQVDPTFGPMILFGAGGTSVELFKDVALASAPLTPASASALMDKVKSTALLRGWRGSPVADEAAVVNALCRLSDFAMTHADQLQSVDINPLLVQQTGAVCLDAVISLQLCP